MSAFFIKKIKAKAVFLAAIITQIIVIVLFCLDKFEYIRLPYLWLNFIGCGLVILIGLLIQSSKTEAQKITT